MNPGDEAIGCIFLFTNIPFTWTGTHYRMMELGDTGYINNVKFVYDGKALFKTDKSWSTRKPFPPKPPEDLDDPPQGTAYFYVNGKWMKYDYATFTMSTYMKPGKTIPITEFMEGYDGCSRNQ